MSTSELPRNLPRHLQRYVVDQQYDRYTETDQGVWRNILHRCVNTLRERAHPIYLEGLRRTGISLDAIPRIETMNAILEELGWQAVTVGGFIPPAAFMEFQARRILVITAQIRKPENLEYTPSPDIVHEAAGHAPIIADPHYADYLARFGEVGVKAIASRHDYELFDAIKRLSDLKESPEADPRELAVAGARLSELQGRTVEPSELARISRLHWWTVEYGLITDPAGGSTPKLYGAGLLSSLGEAMSCLDPAVTKLPLGPEACDYGYDITTRQPQLFVARDFSQLSEVLETVTRGFAYRTGGSDALRRAIESGRPATCVYSSGLQVSGCFRELLTGRDGAPIFLKTSGPTALAFEDRELPGHSCETHPEGYSSPVGPWAEPVPTLQTGRRATLRYRSGITVEGLVERMEHREGELCLIRFLDCTVRRGEQLLAGPHWTYDLAVGEAIPSVFGGVADREQTLL